MEAKLKLKLNKRETRDLIGILGETGKPESGIQYRAPSIRAIAMKAKRQMPKAGSGKPGA